MSDDRRPRVLLGDLDPIARLGMIAVLEEDGVDVIGEEERPEALVLVTGRLQPDAVVLDLDSPSARALAERVRAASPAVTVVLWAREEDAMEVLDPGAPTPRRFFSGLLDQLRDELRAVAGRTAG
jgi:DNA-binding NarL/FixJ family response regulator